MALQNSIYQALSAKTASEYAQSVAMSGTAIGTGTANSFKERDVSEIERELSALQAAIDTLTVVFDDLRSRIEPVSAPAGVCAAAQQGTAPEQPTSSQVAGGIQAARARAQYLTHRLREAIDLLRC